MKLKAIKVISVEGGVSDIGAPEQGFIGFSHAHGFGCLGEFTACDVDLAWGSMETEYTPFVDCPACIKYMNSVKARIKLFKVKK